MEPFDVAVTFRMVVSRTAMRDAKSRKCFHEARRGELRAIVRGQNQLALATPGPHRGVGNRTPYEAFSAFAVELNSESLNV